MKQQKPYKKDLNPKTKHTVDNTVNHGKLISVKEKYKHMGHWLDEDDDSEVHFKKKKKAKA